MQSFSEVDYGAPNAFFVFLVGNNEEWPENRVEQGDIALFNEYLAVGVPANQIRYVKDKKATQKICQDELEDFLETSRPHTTLVFYYGGHGQPNGLNTGKARWDYADITATIEKRFKGERVLFLLDCCASGNLARWLMPPFTASKDYVSIGNTAPFVVATDEGEEWVHSNSWLRGMRCNTGNLPLSRVIDMICDRTALILGDQATAFVSPGVDCSKGDWMPRRKPNEASGLIEWEPLYQHIPKDGRVTSRWSEGSNVFYKHPGGSYKPDSEYLPPGWFLSTILAIIDEENVELKVEYPWGSFNWTVQTRRCELMNDFYMAKLWMIPDGIEKAQYVLARNYKYLDFSIEVNTTLKVKDGVQLREARVVDWRYFNVKRHRKVHGCSNDAPYGAHVTAVWCDTGEETLLPLQKVLSPNVNFRTFIKSLEEVKGREQFWMRQALFWSIESCGKQICNARDEYGSKLQAFWPEDDEWYDAKPLDPHSVDLEVLASHVHFTPKGKYCPLRYEDGESFLSPWFYVSTRSSCPCVIPN